MNYIELSIDDVANHSKQLHAKIAKDYDYDLVIFIAKGSYLIGKTLAEMNKTPLLEISAKRKGNKIKSVLSPIAKHLPKTIKLTLRNKEISSGVHKKAKERIIKYDQAKYIKHAASKKILLVDDSIDTGQSIIQAENEIKKFFNQSVIKIAALNVMDYSEINADYTLYVNYILNGPWSNDSRYHKKHTQMYSGWKNSKE